MDPHDSQRNLGVTIEWDKNERQRARNRINQRNYRKRKSEQLKEREKVRGKSASRSPGTASVNISDVVTEDSESSSKGDGQQNTVPYNFQASSWPMTMPDRSQSIEPIMMSPGILEHDNSSAYGTPEHLGRPDEWHLASSFGSHLDIPGISSQLHDFAWPSSSMLEAGSSIPETSTNTSSQGKTTLHLAAENNHSQSIRTLLRHGADPNLRDYAGHTPLHIAAKYGHLEVISTLIEGGCDLNSMTLSGRTALHLAAENNHLEIIEKLLLAGCDPNIQIQNR